MTERMSEADRNQGGTRENSAAAVAWTAPADRPTDQREADAVPLSDGSVRNGGAFMGGESPEDAMDPRGEPMKPLDSREHFGGDGAHYVDPALGGAAPPDVADARPGREDDR